MLKPCAVHVLANQIGWTWIRFSYRSAKWYPWGGESAILASLSLSLLLIYIYIYIKNMLSNIYRLNLVSETCSWQLIKGTMRLGLDFLWSVATRGHQILHSSSSINFRWKHDDITGSLSRPRIWNMKRFITFDSKFYIETAFPHFPIHLIYLLCEVSRHFCYSNL